MKGGKRRNYVDPAPPPPSAAEDGGVVVGGKCAEAEGTLPPVLETPAGEEKRTGTPAKAAAGADSGAGDDEEEKEEDAEEEEEEEEEEGERWNDEDDLENGDGEAGGERPKLAEGFYEIEAVRKKRVRKGQVQYLIKWRGWPETANTWEPLDNLMSVSDVIDAFEESLQSRSGKRSSRKRKGKYGSSRSQTKKKQHKLSPAAATYNVPAVKVRIIEEPSLIAPHTVGAINTGGTNVNGITNVEASKRLDENGMKLGPPRIEGTELANAVRVTSDKENCIDKIQPNSQEAQIAGQGAVANGSENTESGETFQLGRCIGARRRKSGSVKRFKQEPKSCSYDGGENAASSSIRSGLGGNQLPQNPDLKSNDIACKHKRDNSKNICDITEIIRPISYSSSISGNTQDVSVTFMAKRADGKEVTVDNKFLKSNNPVVLINFYEQHLRYTVA